MTRHGVLYGLGRVPRRYAFLGWLSANVAIWLCPHRGDQELDE
jgi:hypothetical protein